MAVIGLGVGEQHAIAFQNHSDCRLVTLYDLDSSRSEAVSESLGIQSVARDFEAITSASDVDIVSIASFDDAHFEQVVGALRACKHVFVEKPLCRSVDELRVIKQIWRKKPGLHIVSNLVLRAAPLYVWLRDSIRRGEFGNVYAFDGDYLYGRIEKITHGWRSRVPGYSVMLGGGIHLVDLMLWTTGQKPTSAVACGNRVCTVGTDFGYDDFVSASFRFPSGLIGRVSANFGCVHRHQHAVRVFGTKKTFIYDDQGARVYENRDPGTPAIRLAESPLPQTKGALIPAFVSGIAEQRSANAETQHEFDVVSACVAAERASAEGKLVEIEYV